MAKAAMASQKIQKTAPLINHGIRFQWFSGSRTQTTAPLIFNHHLFSDGSDTGGQEAACAPNQSLTAAISAMLSTTSSVILELAARRSYALLFLAGSARRSNFSILAATAL